LEDILAILTLLVKNTPQISPNLWAALPVVMEAQQTFAYDYLDNMLGLLSRYMQKGTDVICNPAHGVDYQGMFFKMIVNILSKDEAAEYDCSQAAMLACALMQHCQGKMDAYIERYLDVALAEIRKDVALDAQEQGQGRDTSSVKRLFLNMIANIIVYNASACFQLLEAKQATGDLLALWLSLIPSYANAMPREQKTTMMALGNLINMPPGSLPVSIQTQLPKIMDAVVWLCGVMSAEEQATGGEGDDDGEDDDDEEGFDQFDDDLDDDEDIRKPRRGGVTDIDFGAMFGGFDDDEGDDDEPMPLDEVDAVNLFGKAIQSMQGSNTAVFNQLCSQLSDERKATLEAVVIAANQ